jgi:hypothetical protein
MSVLSLLGGIGSMLLSLAQLTATGTVRPPYRPFIDPLEVHGWWWWMLVPMALGIAVVYKAVRVLKQDTPWSVYLREVGSMMAQVILGMVLLVAASYVLVEVYVRWIVGNR